jgi:hypothetical protein
MAGDQTVCLWNNKAFNCAAQSILDEDKNESETVFTSLRNSNEVHLYLANLVSKLGRFSSKLTGMEDEDWEEKVENLINVRIKQCYRGQK